MVPHTWFHPVLNHAFWGVSCLFTIFAKHSANHSLNRYQYSHYALVSQHSYWKWPSRNSWSIHKTWWCSRFFCMFTIVYLFTRPVATRKKSHRKTIPEGLQLRQGPHLPGLWNCWSDFAHHVLVRLLGASFLARTGGIEVSSTLW